MRTRPTAESPRLRRAEPRRARRRPAATRPLSGPARLVASDHQIVPTWRMDEPPQLSWTSPRCASSRADDRRFYARSRFTRRRSSSAGPLEERAVRFRGAREPILVLDRAQRRSRSTPTHGDRSPARPRYLAAARGGVGEQVSGRRRDRIREHPQPSRLVHGGDATDVLDRKGATSKHGRSLRHHGRLRRPVGVRVAARL